MAALFATDDGCAVVSVETTREAAEGGFLEHTRAVAISEDGSCRWVGVELPPTADLVDWRGVLLLSDDTRRKLSDSRLAFRVDGGAHRTAQIAVPELLQDDRVRIDFTRRWFVPDGVDPLAQDRTPPEPDPVTLDVHRTMTFSIPAGDVQTSMYPGGAASARVVEHVTWPATAGASARVLPIPRDAIEVTAAFDPPEGGAVRVVAGGALATPRAVAGPAHLTVEYTLPDPPACGEVVAEAGQQLAWDVTDPEGYVVKDGAFWSLLSHEGQPVLPDRLAVARGLQWRFDRLVLPEPALPLDLKHHRRDLELVSLLRPALWRRARVAPLPGDPLFPRRLYQARSSEVVTSIEAALIVRLYALQAALPADVVLVRPADRGPGDEVCPIGHDEALVRVWFEDRAYWIDPGCPSCAPFELRPVLLGATAYSEDVAVTPDPIRGSARVRVDEDQATVALEGPQALLLRLALEDVGPADRERFVAERYGGVGARLLKVAGLGEAGANVTVVVEAPSGGFGDLLQPGWRATDRDDYWVDAPGTWTVDRVLVDETPADVSIGALHYQRTILDGRVVEVLDIADRTVDSAQVEALAAARRAR